MIPVTAIVVTKNEEVRLTTCLESLSRFQEIVVVDSESRDKTKKIAMTSGAKVINFSWNGMYPKKRQWILDTLDISTKWVFFIDADEVMTSDLANEIANLFNNEPPCDGYFIKGRYRIGGKLLKYGIPNNKLVLFRRTAFSFPAVDDLDIPGMGEIEGHYQPQPAHNMTIGRLKNFLIHDAMEDKRAWAFRHEKYARWEAGMNRKKSWPLDPVKWREYAKQRLRTNIWRPQIIFLLHYVIFLGFLDGRAGLTFARSKLTYYKMIQSLEKTGCNNRRRNGTS